MKLLVPRPTSSARFLAQASVTLRDVERLVKELFQQRHGRLSVLDLNIGIQYDLGKNYWKKVKQW